MAILKCGGIEIAEVDAIIFDKDGTLADARPFLRELARRRAECLEGKLPGSFEVLMAAFGCSRMDINPEGLMAVGARQENLVVAAGFLAQAGYGWFEAMAIAEAAFQAAELDSKAKQTPPYPGTAAMLARLAASRVSLSILSSDSQRGVEEFVDTYRLKTYLDGWQGTQAADLPKPDPQLLLRLCDQLQADPAHVVVVGDTTVDREMARRAGAKAFISVSSAWGSAAVAGADGAIRGWDDLAILGE